jgi:hypothetical protein
MQGLQQLGDQLLQAGLWELRFGDIAHWEVDNNDTSSIARTKRAVLQLISEHLAKARNEENPFWWIASDLGKRKWFHASLHITVRLLCFPNLRREYGVSRNVRTPGSPLFVVAKMKSTTLGE